MLKIPYCVAPITRAIKRAAANLFRNGVNKRCLGGSLATMSAPRAVAQFPVLTTIPLWFQRGAAHGDGHGRAGR
jgi:hypothetical protein